MLVNNAGMFIAKPFREYAEADFTAKIARQWRCARWTLVIDFDRPDSAGRLR
jgi:hypothetical protein